MSARYDLRIDRGADWAFDWVWKNSDGTLKDLSDISEVTCDFRSRADDSVTLVEFSIANGKSSVNTGTSTITLSLTAAETAALSFNEAVYDILITYDDGRVTKPFRGDIQLTPAVTR